MMFYVFKNSQEIMGDIMMSLLLSCTVSSQNPSGWEKVVYVALGAASILLECSGAKVGYICDGE